MKKIKLQQSKYCCKRFKASVTEGKHIHSKGFDETEWFIPGSDHIYFCPFCGKNIKGKGFGVSISD